MDDYFDFLLKFKAEYLDQNKELPRKSCIVGITASRVIFQAENKEIEDFIDIGSICRIKLLKEKKKLILRIISRNLCIIDVYFYKKIDRTTTYKLLSAVTPPYFSPAYSLKEKVPTEKGHDERTVLQETAHECINAKVDFLRLKPKNWRVTNTNKEFTFCPSYPSEFFVPSRLTDEDLLEESLQRTKNRIPILCWYNKRGGYSLTRSSQSKKGILNRQPVKMGYIKAIVECSQKTGKIVVADCRPKINTQAARFCGFGTDLGDFIENVNLGIANFHVMRNSFLGMFEIVVNSCLSNKKFSEKKILKDIAKTQWPKHCQGIIASAVLLSRALSTNDVLVHCSDGWDRTSQVVSLIQIIKDPFYRTISGFCTLIEKEWIQSGHNFNKRYGHGKKTGIYEMGNTNFGPIFQQFLCCVGNLISQRSGAFQYSSKLLLFIHDNVHSLRFGNFLYDNQKERLKNNIKETNNIWMHIMNNLRSFENESYCQIENDLIIDPEKVSVWREFWYRQSMVLQKLFPIAQENQEEKEFFKKRMEDVLESYSKFADIEFEFANKSFFLFSPLVKAVCGYGKFETDHSNVELTCSQDNIVRLLFGIRVDIVSGKEYFGVYTFFESVNSEMMLHYVLNRVYFSGLEVVVEFLECFTIIRKIIPKFLSNFCVRRYNLTVDPKSEIGKRYISLQAKFRDQKVFFTSVGYEQEQNIRDVFSDVRKTMFSKRKDEKKTIQRLETSDGKNEYIHLSIALRMSNFFLRVLSFPQNEDIKIKNVTKIEFLTGNQLKVLIRFLYLDELNIKCGNKEEIETVFILLSFSEMYFEYELRKELINIIASWLNSSNNVKKMLKTYKGCFTSIPFSLRKLIFKMINIPIKTKIEKILEM